MEAEGRDISIILTTYNAAATVGRALSSALISECSGQFEVIVVDDCSTDGTREIVGEYAREYPNVSLYVMPVNTGSPSIPRNTGIERATADYVTFLDDDDYIDPRGLVRMVRYARSRGIQYLKGYLKIVTNGEFTEANRIDGASSDRMTLIRQMISQQSTNADTIIERDFLVRSGVRFDGRIRTGEDTLFATALLSQLPVLGYIDDFFHFYCRRTESGNLSSTQEYGDRALSDHLHVWAEAEENLKKIGLSYFALRLASAVGHSLRSIVSFSRGGITETRFQDFSRFIRDQSDNLAGIRLHDRHREIYEALERGDYVRFLKASKRRLLVAEGGDRSEMREIALLSDDYDIRIDDWHNPVERNGQAAREMLNWADFIWCGCPGPAEWYVGRKLAHQTLVLRLGACPDETALRGIDTGKVDAFAVSGYYNLCQWKEKCGLPEEKLHIVGIAAKNDVIDKPAGVEYRYGIKMLCDSPEGEAHSYSGDLLEGLKEVDGRFELLARSGDGARRAGFGICPLDACEGCDEAAVNAVASGMPVLLRKTLGREYLFPPSWLSASVEDMATVISACADEHAYEALLREQRQFVAERYSREAFISSLKALLERIRLGVA